MKQRDISLDFLRVIATISVVWLHVSADVVMTNPDLHSTKWWTGNITDAFTRWCVPVFVMINGALVLSSPSNLTPIEFYKKRASRLFPSTVFWTLIYLVVRKHTESPFDLQIAAKSIIAGIPYYHLWYLYMIIGLHLVAPFLRLLVEGITIESLRLLIAVCFIIAAIESPLDGSGNTFFPLFLPFIGYFLAGHYLLHHYTVRNNRLLVSIFLVSGCSVAIGAAGLFPLFGQRGWNIMYDYLNPVVINMSLCIFLLFAKNANILFLPVNLVRRIAPVSLGIYLMHPLWLLCLSNFGVNGFLIHPIVGIPFTSLLAFALSAVSAALLANIPVLRRVVL